MNSVRNMCVSTRDLWLDEIKLTLWKNKFYFGQCKVQKSKTSADNIF